MGAPGTPEERFTLLVSEVGEPVRRYLVRRLPADHVDDVLAEVFLVLWRRLDDVPADAPLPWAYAVARRSAANARRAGERQRALVEKVTRLRPSSAYGDPDRSDPDYDDSGLDDTGFEEVHRALAMLGDLDRELVTLWAWEQLAPREIAAVLDLTPNAVSIRLTRAKQRLREALGKDRPPAGHRPGEGSGQ